MCRSLAALAVLMLGISAAPARAGDADEIAAGLQSFAQRLDDFASFGELGDNLPLTAFSPTGDGGLHLANLLEDTLGAALAGALPDLSALATAIDGADNPNFLGLGISIEFSNVMAAMDGGNPSLINVSFDVAATRAVNLPVSFTDATDPINFQGGGVSMTLALSSSLSFQLDKTASDPNLAFYLPTAPTVLITATSPMIAITGFDDLVGFADVSITGTAMVDIDVAIAFNDPDDNGRLTLDEWVATSLADLADVAFVEEPGDEVAITLNIDSSLIGAMNSTDGTIALVDADLTNGLSAPTVTLNFLDDFTNIKPTQILSGLSSLASMIAASEMVGDVQVPFLKRSLGETFDFVKPLADFLRQQSDAAIVCGTIADDPPRGNIVNLPLNAEFFCQATTLEIPTVINWLAGSNVMVVGLFNADGTEVVAPTPADFLTSSGTNATRIVKLKMTAAGRPDIKLEFKNLADTAFRQVSRLFLSTDELLTKLASLAGFDNAGSNVQYDPMTKSLTYRLKKMFNPDPFGDAVDGSESVPLDFSDRLKEITNLTGLSATGSASAMIDVGNVEVDLTFGVILVTNLADITPGVEPAREDDRFFMKVRTGADDHEFVLNDATVTATIDLEGRIGFLGVKVAGDGAANMSNPGTAFEVVRADASKPMLSLNVNPTAGGIPITGASTITDAALIRDLITDLTNRLNLAANIKMTGGLKVTAGTTTPAFDVMGQVSLNWPDVTTGTPTVTATTDFAEKLQRFDTDPSIFGTHTGANDATAMTDASKTFPAKVEGRTLRNLTDGSHCVVTGISMMNTLACALEGGTENRWDLGDRYEIVGNPFDLLSIILDNFDTIVKAIDDLNPDLLHKELPLVGISPEELLSFLNDLESTLDAIRSGVPEVRIICTRDTPPAGVDAQNLAGLLVGDKISCKAMTRDEVTVSSASWTVVDLMGMPVATIDMNQNDIATVGKPSCPTCPPNPPNAVMMTFTKNATIGKEFKIRVSYTDGEGMHSAELPEKPTTLQTVEETIENELGLPATALKLELLDLPPPGSNAADMVQDLVIRLGFGQCTQDNTDCLASDRRVPKLALQANLGLEDLNVPGLVQVGTEDPDFQLEYAARAQLDLAIPLPSSFDGAAIRVVDTSGVTLSAKAQADASDLIMASIGPLMVKLGGQAKLGASFSLNETTNNGTAATDNDETFAVSSYVSKLMAALQGPGNLSCGTLAIPEVITGTHQGAGPTDDGVNDPGKFSAGNVGATLRNLTTDQECTVTDVVGDHTLKCLDMAAMPIVTWDAGDEYEVVDADANPAVALMGDACAKLSLELEGVAVGELGFKAADIEDPDDLTTEAKWFAHLSADSAGLLAQLDVEDLAWELILEVLKYVVAKVDEIIAGGSSKLDLPIVGKRLDGGAQVCSSLGTATATATASGGGGLLGALKGLEAALDAAPDPEEIRKTIQDTFFDALGSLLQDTDGSAVIEKADVEVMVTGDGCSGPMDTCLAADSLGDIDDVRITFLMGQGKEPTQGCADADPAMCPPGDQIPFDLGVPGVPLGIEGSLETKAGWRFLVDFGLSRTLGPYLGATGPRHAAADAELRIGASVGIGGAVMCSDTSIPAIDDGYDSTMCVKGRLAFLSIMLWDGASGGGAMDPKPTELALLSKLNFTGSSEKIGFQQLTGGQAGLNLKIEADANVDVRFRAGIDGTDAIPEVLGAFHLGWDIATAELDTNSGARLDFGSTPDVMFDRLHLGVGGFFNEFLGPMLRNVSKATKPLQPVIDVVRAPLPLVSDISELVGGPKITLLSLMEIVSGNDLSMIENLITLIEVINRVAGLNDGDLLATYIPLDALSQGGAFLVDAAEALKGPKTPDKAGQLIQNPTVANGLLSKITNEPLNCVSFPFLEDSRQIFAMILGQDVTLMRFDAGEMKASATLGPFTYCCIPVGPVPVSVFIEGSGTIKGRFAMGYDTFGLRKAFMRKQVDATALVNLVDGVFIDDLDAQGRDVPEISLIGEVRAGAGVDIGFAAAGLEGGVRMTVDLNLDDRPEPDGKLRLQEVVNRLSNPICLFDVSGRLEAFLGAWVRVGFEWFSKTWRFEILNITLLEFSGACEPPDPEPATVTGAGHLLVNIGSQSRRDARRIAVDEVEEEVVIRPLDVGNTRFSVTMFGVTEDYPKSGQPAITEIEVNGDDGNDIISLVPGVERKKTAGECVAPGEILGKCGNNDICSSNADCSSGMCTKPTLNVECVFPFTRKATIRGGSGNDKISSGGGNDDLFGDDGDDKISGGNGNDMIHGGANNDVLAGEAGTDTIHGNAGDDTITGGPGGDMLFGDDDNDDINGGPGTNNERGNPNPSPDGNDTIEGGNGMDIIQGFYGDDVLYGDEAVACGAAGAATGGMDKIDGGPGNDMMFGGFGDDALGGEEGNDTLCGNAGNDMLDGDDVESATPDGDDELHGGADHDQLFGRGGHDVLFGDADNDALYGEGDADDLIGGGGRDILFGGAGRDILLGDDGTIGGHNHSHPDDGVLAAIIRNDGAAVGAIVPSGGCVVTLDFLAQPVLGGPDGDNADCLFGGDESDFLFGEAGHDRMFGDGAEGQCAAALGAPHEDYMEGNSGNDIMRGGIDADRMFGNSGDDEVFGDSGADRMYGCDHATTDCQGLSDKDLMRGGKDDDYMEGNADTDTMFGDSGQDDMVGGSTVAGMNDAGDTMHGNSEQDVMVGDNAMISRPGGSSMADGTMNRVVTRLDLGCASQFGGMDIMNGNAGNDDMYGACADDTMHGNEGDDYLEGNHAADLMFGDQGQDDLIGGTARVVSNDDTTAIDGRSDGGDEMHGGDGVADLFADFDVLVGDNAVIDRPLGADQKWQINTFNAAVVRSIRFLDIGIVGAPAAASASGPDMMFGEGNDDLLYGQGNDDFLSGGTGEDYMEGNADSDDMEGNEGNDDMVGGTGRINNDGPAGTNGRLDAGDLMRGNAGFDVMAGDNALLVRTLVGGAWQSNTFNAGIQHEPRILLDIDSPDSALVSGVDTMFGNPDDDLMYGQGDGDEMHGNEGDDFMEGNAGSDTMTGDENEDDMIGGTVEPGLGDIGDFMHGNDADDVMAGDNATITRPLDAMGMWIPDPNSTPNGVLRSITLFDVEKVAGPAVDQDASGSDLMFGDDGRDLMFGQGNDQNDADGDGRFNEDPVDGVDNDRDGRENAASEGYDCEDGVDFGEDGLADCADPDCFSAIDEDDAGDEMHGGGGPDYMEGNHGSDWMFGDDGEDDMIGGNSAGNGVIGGGVPPTNLLDGDDIMAGGGEDDVLLGDNGQIIRPVDASGVWMRHTGFGFDLAVRVTVMDQVPEAVGAYGHDYMKGDSDHDDMYGQLGNDYMEGNDEQDAVLGDLGRITNRVEDGSRQRVITIPVAFFEETIFAAGTMHRLAELYAFLSGGGAEGHDTILGGDGRDSLHGCAGNDFVNGDGDSLAGEDPIPATDDEDHLFGGDGNDVMWGGRGHDHLWGGYHDDHLDVRPRVASQVTAPDGPEWFTYGEPDHYQGLDVIHGGWDRDAMQANVAIPGPPPADRLIDWVGGFNVFYVCPGAYGEGTITRQHSPSLLAFLRDLASADGALLPHNAGTSGFRELAYVFPNEARPNSHPPHPDHPGHFVCDDGAVMFNSSRGGPNVANGMPLKRPYTGRPGIERDDPLTAGPGIEEPLLEGPIEEE